MSERASTALLDIDVGTLAGTAGLLDALRACDPDATPQGTARLAAERLRGMLSPLLRDRMRALGRLEFDGLVLRGMPTDADLGPTPLDGMATARQVWLGAGLLLGLIDLLGSRSLSYARINGGQITCNVTPVAGKQEEHSSRGSVHFDYHTEGANLPLPSEDGRGVSPSPDFLTLYCARGEPGVMTNLVSVDTLLDALPAAYRAALARADFRVNSGPIYAAASNSSNVSLIRTDAMGRRLFRYNADQVKPLSDEAAEALGAVKALLADPAFNSGVVLAAGDVLLLNNRSMLHGRSEFHPRFDGTDRWLVRIYGAREELFAMGRPASADRPFEWLT